MSLAFLEVALRRARNDPTLRLTGSHGVGGGCISASTRLSTTTGDFFAKWNGAGPPDLFLREAEGLAALRATGSPITIPRVVAASGPAGGDPAFLILEYLAPARPGPQHDEHLGRGLAAIHRHGAERFGFGSPSYCGSTLQDNRRSESWVEFYRERRLRPLVERLDRAGRMMDRSLYERLADRLHELLDHPTTPSLTHGDLWSGNVLSTARGPALIDPACAYADREMDFGISTLFGGLSERTMAAYEEAWPLPAGWRERNGLYQLYHLLNHALLFGGGYVDQARETARRYL